MLNILDGELLLAHIVGPTGAAQNEEASDPAQVVHLEHEAAGIVADLKIYKFNGKMEIFPWKAFFKLLNHF